MKRTHTIAMACSLTLAPPALAQSGGEGAETGEFRLDVGATTIEFDSGSGAFGHEGDAWWSLGGGAGFSDDSTEANAYAMAHWFIADDIEFNLTFGGFYHGQDGDDAVSGNFAFGWRWHFVNKPEQSWYLDIGIGALGSSDDVPEGGTSFNFTPRGGVGTTVKLFDDSRIRLDLGLRWYHFSNASISGSDDNPARDGLQVYAGVMIPW